MIRTFFGLVLFASAVSAASIGGSVAADAGGTVNLTTLGTLDWAHYGFLGGGTGGADPEQDRKVGGAILNTPTNTRDLFKFYNFSQNTYSWSDGTPHLSGSMTNGAAVNDGDVNGGLTEIILTAAASTAPMRLVIYLGTGFLGGSQPAPLANINASLNDGSGATFAINNISGSNILTLDYSANAPSLLTVSLNSLALRPTGGPEYLVLDAAYVTAGQISAGAPEPSSLLLLAGGIAALYFRRRSK